MTRELVVGVDHAPPVPLCFGLPGTPEFRGFEVDLLTDVAATLGVTLRFRSALWRTILEELQDGQIDLVCAAATITAERARDVAFSDPYYQSDLALVTRFDRRIEDPNAIAALRVGVRVATVAEQFIRERCLAGNIETFDLNVVQYEALAAGQLDAVCDDRPIASHFAKVTPSLLLGPHIPRTSYDYGIVFAHGNDHLRRAVNGAMAAMREGGRLRELERRWFADD